MSIEEVQSQLLYEYVNWRISSHQPVPPIGNVAHYKSKSFYVDNVTHNQFTTAADKMAKKAAGKMSDEDFHMLLCTIPEDKKKRARHNLRKWRRENPDDGVDINPPFPFNLEELRQAMETPCAKINRYTPAGRRLLMDFVDHETIGFDPKFQAGCVDHWRSREIYQTVSKDAFCSEAKMMSKDATFYTPDSIQMEEMFQEAVKRARMEEAMRNKLRSGNK